MEENTSPVEQVGSVDILVILLAKEVERTGLLEIVRAQQVEELDELRSELAEARRVIDDQTDEISDLISERYDHLQTIEDLRGAMVGRADPMRHPEFLESVGDYTSAPVGTIVLQLGSSGQHTLTRQVDGWVYSGSLALAEPLDLAGAPRRVLLWGGK